MGVSKKVPAIKVKDMTRGKREFTNYVSSERDVRHHWEKEKPHQWFKLSGLEGKETKMRAKPCGLIFCQFL